MSYVDLADIPKSQHMQLTSSGKAGWSETKISHDRGKLKIEKCVGG